MWKTPLEMIQNYITCEGRYDRVLRCHLCFLMLLSGDQKLNLPYYLLKSLQKMIARLHNHQEYIVRSLFHQGLIKLLIVFHLKKKGKIGNISFLYQDSRQKNRRKRGKKMNVKHQVSKQSKIWNQQMKQAKN